MYFPYQVCGSQYDQKAKKACFLHLCHLQRPRIWILQLSCAAPQSAADLHLKRLLVRAAYSPVNQRCNQLGNRTAIVPRKFADQSHSYLPPIICALA